MQTLLQRQRVGMRAALLGFVCVLGLSATARAQDPRGAVAGRVIDSSGGALPGTTVTVTNEATGTANTATTDENGRYSIPFISPGTYTMLVELTGFKRTERKGVEVRIADRLEVDFTLEVGGLEETITVEGGTPLLDTRSASQGQVIDEKRIQLMPLSDGNPFTLTRLAAGTVYTGDLKFSRPFDNGGTSAVTSNGAAGGNEFTLDGSPNMANGRRVAFTPPAGAVQEFKVETATFDAQQGHTAGATVNVTMKAGTNQFHGDGYYHYRDEALAKNDSEEVIKKFTGGKTPAQGKIKLDLPEIAENGNTVPMTVTVESPMTAQSHVTDVLVLASENPRSGVATFHFSPAGGVAEVIA